jgi:hypothetical protein
MELHDHLSFIKLLPADKVSGCRERGYGIGIMTLINHGEKVLSDSKLIVIQQGGSAGTGRYSRKLTWTF